MNALLEIIVAIHLPCVKIQSQIILVHAKMDLLEMVFHVKVLIFFFFCLKFFYSKCKTNLNKIKFRSTNFYTFGLNEVLKTNF